MQLHSLNLYLFFFFDICCGTNLKIFLALNLTKIEKNAKSKATFLALVKLKFVCHKINENIYDAAKANN